MRPFLRPPELVLYERRTCGFGGIDFAFDPVHRFQKPVARDALPVGQVANQPEHRVAVLAAADRNQYFIELSEVENPADETELRPLRRVRLKPG